MLTTVKSPRDLRDVQEQLDDLSRRSKPVLQRVRRDRFTRHDNDLISRREVRSILAEELTSVGGAVPTFDNLTPLGTETGSSWTLSQTPVSADDAGIYLNGVLLARVNAAPSNSQYTLSGTTLTTGRSLVAGERLRAIYTATGQRVAWEVLADGSQAGTSWTLSNTPSSDDEVAVYLNGTLLAEVAAAPTNSQYTISGANITTGRALVAGERLRVMYVF